MSQSSAPPACIATESAKNLRSSQINSQGETIHPRNQYPHHQESLTLQNLQAAEQYSSGLFYLSLGHL